MIPKAFVRATRPSFYALVLKSIYTHEITRPTGGLSHEELNRAGIPFFGTKSATPTVG